MTDTTTEPDWDALHDALPDDAHTCPEWNLDARGCYLATPCAGTFPDGTACRTRRDEHADQPYPSGFLSLDIRDHAFVQPTGPRTEAFDTPQVGDWALHKDGTLDARQVTQVDGDQVWLRIGKIEGGPFDADRYTYSRQVS